LLPALSDVSLMLDGLFLMSVLASVASLLKRWLGATHQGRVQKPHLQAYPDEYAFRFNCRRSMHVGKIFHRLVEQMVIHKAKTYRELVDAATND
jgi:hypothetical protein